MELASSDDEKMAIRFDPGEEVVSGLISFAKDSGIDAAFISGIGSASEVELGFYNALKKKYRKTVFTEPLEVLDMTGNLGLLDTEITVHLHGSFGRPNFEMLGGHIHRLVVNTTVEVMLDTMGGEMRRAYDEETGLNILSS